MKPDLFALFVAVFACVVAWGLIVSPILRMRQARARAIRLWRNRAQVAALNGDPIPPAPFGATPSRGELIKSALATSLGEGVEVRRVFVNGSEVHGHAWPLILAALMNGEFGTTEALGLVLIALGFAGAWLYRRCEQANARRAAIVRIVEQSRKHEVQWRGGRVELIDSTGALPRVVEAVDLDDDGNIANDASKPTPPRARIEETVRVLRDCRDFLGDLDCTDLTCCESLRNSSMRGEAVHDSDCFRGRLLARVNAELRVLKSESKG
jgi:hypothetical protein